MKKAIIYQKEECVIIRNINLSDKVFAFFVAVSSKKIIYLKENIYNGNVTYAALDKMIQSLREYQVPAIFNTKILLDTFVNTINYKIRHGYITDSDEILEMILQFEKIVKDPYILQMTAPNVNQIFSREAMYEVTNTIKKIDGKVKKMSLAGLINNPVAESNDVFASQNWLETDIDNKELVYNSIKKSNKLHRKSAIDFLFNNKILNIYMVIMIVAVVTFASCLQMISTWKTTGKDTEKTIDEIKEEVLIADPSDDNNAEFSDPNAIDPTKQTSNKTSNKTSNNKSNKTSNKVSKYGKVYTDYANMSVLQVDFNKLKKINYDTVGWIYINNTGDSKSDNINYPVVQGKDNSYYLNHDFNRKKNVAGWIYGDYRDDFNNFKKNTVIYGHGRADGVMFGNLEKTLKKEWYTDKNNHYIKFSTPKKDTLWRIVSIYVIKGEQYPLTVNFENDKKYKIWIDKLLSRSIYNFGYKPTVKNKFMTLQTCKDYKGNRIFVHAVLVTSQNK